METRPSFQADAFRTDQSSKADQDGFEFSVARRGAKITAKAKIRSGYAAAVSLESNAKPNKSTDVAIHTIFFLPLRKLRYARKLASSNTVRSKSFTEESQATFSTCTGCRPKRIAARAAVLRLPLNFPAATKTR